MKVPWLEKQEITGKAQALLAEYACAVGHAVEPPIPVEAIIKNHLGLKLGFVDFENSLGLKGVLGATYVKARLICLNENLREAWSEGRKTFTCAHEVGHWLLHRHYAETAGRSEREVGSIICRSASAREPIEWQADFFAACLLMPEEAVGTAFREVCGSDTLAIRNIRSSLGGTSLCVDPCVENWHLIADLVRETGGFANVSKQAMAVRLQELGLLVNFTGAEIGWDRSCSHRM
jgi:Zn-dependent peptidase ImmA (M78 family)